jgi:AcrR family transcriptional regulator
MEVVKTPTPRGRGRPDEGVRDAVLEAATALFVERNYDDVTTEDIIGRAGVSRGALYHHFPGKLDLFRVVYDASERRAMARIAAVAGEAGGPFDVLLAASRAYLREAETSIELRRIGIIQSRAVLGWEGWRTAAAELGLGFTRAALAAAMEAGEIKRRDLETTSHLMIAALVEGATLIATAENPGAVRPEVEELVVDLLNALR